MKAMVSKKANQRILAAILACVMLFSLIYTSSPSAAETETHKNCITVSVVDEDGKAVEGARVEYSISSKQEGKVKSDIATTDDSGVVEVFSTTEYEKYPEGDLSVSAEVTKTGYEGAVLAGDVTSGKHDFQMTIKENKITGVVIKAVDNLKYNGSAQELVSVTGTKEGDKVSYKLGDGEFSTEVPKATELGTYNVSVKVEREGYPDYEENVEVTIAHGQITGIEIKPYDGKYDGQEHELVSVSGTVAGDVVKYYVGDDEEGTTTVPKATEVGTYPIKKITIERTNYDTYVQENISANIALGQINGGDLIKAVKDLEYNGMDQALVEIASNAEKNGYSFKFKLGENAEYSDELPKAKDAGDYKVYVEISKEKYEDKEMEINTSIKKADPGLKFNDKIDDVIKDGIKFEGKEIADINFSASMEKAAEFDKDITYEIINNGYDEKDDASEIASIDKSGKVTIKKGGYILKVIAKVDEHNNYAAASVTKEVVVKDIKPELSIDGLQEINNEYVYILGRNDGNIATVNKSEDDNGAITLDKVTGIAYDNNTVKVSDYKDIISELEKSDINKGLSVNLQVTKAAGTKTSKDDPNGERYEVYSERKVEKAITIKYAGQVDNSMYNVIEGKEGKAGWYVSDVVVEPTKQDSYFIAKYDENDELEFADSITVGEDEAYKIVLKEKGNGKDKGGILKPCQSTLNIDTSKPEISNVEFVEEIKWQSSTNLANDIIDAITYHYYGGSREGKPVPVKVKFNATDKISGINEDGFEWQYTYTDENGIANTVDGKDGEIVKNKDENDNIYYLLTIDVPANFARKDVNEINNASIAIRAIDKAGNKSEFSNDSNQRFVYDTVGANVNVTIKSDGSDPYTYAGDDAYYFNSKATFEVKITEANFHSEDVTVIVDGSKQEINSNTWNKEINIGEQHNIKVSYKDRSGNNSNFNLNEQGDICVNEREYTVIVEDDPPKVTFDYGKVKQGDVDAKEKVHYYNGSMELTTQITEAHFNDSTTKITVYKNGEEYTNSANNKKDVVFKKLKEKAPVCEIRGEEGKNNKYQISVENTDKCGNTGNATSETVVIDRTTPKISVTYVDGTPINGEYFNDKNSKTIKISVKEENFKSTADDIKVSAVDYAGGPVYIGKLDCEWSDENGEHITKITLSKDAKYTIEVKNTDKAGNSGNAGPVTFTIDNTDPQGLYVTYNGNENISSPNYSNSPVSVTLHAKDAVSGIDYFKYKTVKTDGSSGINGGYVEKTVNFKNKEISYSKESGEFTYTFTLEPQFDGHVEFTAVDNAGNDASFGDTKRIVVDNKAPTSSVTFNTPVQNVGGTSYYDGNITATININEANFNARNITVSATKDGVNYPVSTSWSGSGDSHTGIVTLSEDGDYNVSIKGTDEANNNMTPYTSENLTIDTDITEPVITVNGLEADGKAFKDKVIPAVKFEDTNLDSYEITLLRTRYGEKNVDVTKDFIKNHMSVNMGTGVGEGEFDEFAKIQDNDGIYTLKAKIADKAGHESEKQIVFTVNRYGSIYVYDDYLVDLIAEGGAYVQSIDKDLIITEYNPDKLVSQSLNVEISKDGKPLEIAAPAISPEINDRVTTGSSGWYQYQYTISKDNFAADGIYKIVVSSKDETGNNPQNTNYEDKTILFRVDSTAPEINSITGLENKIINATGVTVKYTIFDTISLASVDVYVNGEKVESVSDFGDDFNNYSGEVQLKESSSEQSVRIVATDKAGNVTDTDSSDFTSAYKFNSKVTVSTNVFVRWFANKLLFFGSIAGVLILIGGVSFLIVLGKRRKKKTA